MFLHYKDTNSWNDTYHKQFYDTLDNVQNGNKGCKDLFCEASEQFHQDTTLKTYNHQANNSQPNAYIYTYREKIKAICQTELKQM